MTNAPQVDEIWYHSVYGTVRIVGHRSGWKQFECAIECQKLYERTNEIFLAFKYSRFEYKLK